MSDPLPTLWQIDVSHYSEKARRALAQKGSSIAAAPAEGNGSARA